MQPVILASQSPRRKELLGRYGIPFEVVPSGADESFASGSAQRRVAQLCRAKAQEVASRFPGRIVLAADTLVSAGGEILGKPKDTDDVRRMFSLLSGSVHEVWTGVCLITENGELLADEAVTRVTFLPVDPDWLERYSRTAEPMDKAGAYAIQGRAGIWVEQVEGSESNVIGLPLNVVTRLFLKAGISF